MRVARSGLWFRVWASRNCLLEESKRLSASIPALRAGYPRHKVKYSEISASKCLKFEYKQ